MLESGRQLDRPPQQECTGPRPHVRSSLPCRSCHGFRRARIVALLVGSVGGCAGTGPVARGPRRRAARPARGRRACSASAAATLEGLIGQPALVRSEQQAQYWRYSLGGCQLDLFLYADREPGRRAVAYLDVRPSAATPRRHARRLRRAGGAAARRAGGRGRAAGGRTLPASRSERSGLSWPLAARAPAARRPAGAWPEPRRAGCCWLGSRLPGRP